MYGPALPEVEYERFSRPPLRAMLGQVQFPPILKLQTGLGAVADFQEAVRDKFPGFAEEAQLQINVAFGGQAEPATSRTTVYRFTSADSTWSAVLAPNALSLEAVDGAPYTSYDAFSDGFRLLWTAAVEHLRPGAVSQQGLRYIDHLEGDRSASEWADWINPELLGGVAGDVLGVGVKRSVSEMLYPQETGQVVFRHGITTAGPADAPGYLLDFDATHAGPIAAEDTDAIVGRFDESHSLLYAFFRWCVTEKALEEFGRGAS